MIQYSALLTGELLAGIVSHAVHFAVIAFFLTPMASYTDFIWMDLTSKALAKHAPPIPFYLSSKSKVIGIVARAKKLSTMTQILTHAKSALKTAPSAIRLSNVINAPISTW